MRLARPALLLATLHRSPAACWAASRELGYSRTLVLIGASGGLGDGGGGLGWGGEGGVGLGGLGEGGMGLGGLGGEGGAPTKVHCGPQA